MNRIHDMDAGLLHPDVVNVLLVLTDVLADVLLVKQKHICEFRRCKPHFEDFLTDIVLHGNVLTNNNHNDVVNNNVNDKTHSAGNPLVANYFEMKEFNEAQCLIKTIHSLISSVLSDGRKT